MAENIAMDKEPKRNSAQWQGVVAFYLSIATAAFSIFQWFNSEASTRVEAALGISKQFLEDKDFDTQWHLFNVYARSEYLNPGDESTVFRFIDKLEYVALLVNEERVNQTYVSNLLKCYITTVSSILAKHPRPISQSPTPELKKFRRNQHLNCVVSDDQLIPIPK